MVITLTSYDLQQALFNYINECLDVKIPKKVKNQYIEIYISNDSSIDETIYLSVNQKNIKDVKECKTCLTDFAEIELFIDI